jgi:omega-amidase
MRDLSALPDLNIALVQTTLAWHDRQANLEHFELLLEQAKGADLIVLPEMFTTGFSMDSATLAEPPNGPTHHWLQAQAKKHNAVITGSVIIQAADGSHRNRLLWARPDGEVWHYDKRHLFRMAGEHNHYTPGERQVQFELKGWRIRPLICYDLRFPVWSRDAQDTDFAYTRDSQVLDFQGETLLSAGEADGVFQVCLNAAELGEYRARFPANLDADTFQFV